IHYLSEQIIKPFQYKVLELKTIKIIDLLKSALIEFSEIKKLILETTNISEKFILEQNYSNPFNPATKIRYIVPLKVKSQNSKVEMKVYDILGNEVATLVNEEKSDCVYETDFDGSNLTSGIYFYKMTSGDFNSVKK
ncbi:MAG: T9SS type A sorting domain-containing protein, partial [Ignavibacterium sp.]|nr:T9SS type A sorting domain-containing protein [Ignavibacterium sp.]